VPSKLQARLPGAYIASARWFYCEACIIGPCVVSGGNSTLRPLRCCRHPRALIPRRRRFFQTCKLAVSHIYRSESARSCLTLVREVCKSWVRGNQPEKIETFKLCFPMFHFGLTRPYTPALTTCHLHIVLSLCTKSVTRMPILRTTRPPSAFSIGNHINEPELSNPPELQAPRRLFDYTVAESRYFASPCSGHGCSTSTLLINLSCWADLGLMSHLNGFG
jgi:hypothetical protein